MNKKIVLVCLSTLLFICGCNNNTSSINITSEVSEEDGILKNNLKKLNVNGYVGTNLKNNIKYWQSTAYKNNPNIISQISLANQTNAKTSLSSILGNDYSIAIVITAFVLRYRCCGKGKYKIYWLDNEFFTKHFFR